MGSKEGRSGGMVSECSHGEGAQTVVRTTGDSKAFNVKVGLHQRSVLSPLLFVIVMEMLSGELRAGLPFE